MYDMLINYMSDIRRIMRNTSEEQLFDIRVIMARAITEAYETGSEDVQEVLGRKIA